MLKTTRLHALTAAVAFAAVAGSTTVAAAAPLYASYDNFNYSGTVTRYGSLADAQGAINALSIATIATATNDTRSTLTSARDGQIYMASGAPGYDPSNTAYFSTSWYFTTFSANGDGWGNPNNANNGFVQYYDDTVAPAVSGGWSNGYTRFTVNVSGGDGDSYNYARLWAPDNSGGPAGETGGIFRSFNLTMTADFTTAATLSSTTGWYETGAMPSSVSGNAKGIFENQSTTNPSANGFYAFDFGLAQGSWAADNNATWNNGGSTDYSPSALFAAPVPEPETWAMMLTALGLVGFAVRRRRI